MIIEREADPFTIPELTGPVVGHHENTPSYQFLGNLACIVVTGDQTVMGSGVEINQPEWYMTPAFPVETGFETTSEPPVGADAVSTDPA